MSTSFLSAQAVVLDLLRNIGVTGFTPPENEQLLNQPGIDTDDIRRALIAVNSALQTIQKWGPQDLKYGRRSASYVAPLQVTLAVIAGSKAATGPIPLSATGCSIRIDGDSDLNRVMHVGGSNAVTLLRSYLGATGSVSATVFSDCALLDADVQAVQEPVHGTGNLRLYPCQDIDEFERLRDRYWSYYWRLGVGGMTYTAYVETSDTIGQPSRFMVERQRNGIPFLRVTPMTAVAINVTFQAKLRAERIDESVLDVNGGDDPAYEFTSLHKDEVESVLLPIARWRFFVHPALKNAETRANVKAEYDEVMKTLMSGTTMQSSVTRSRGSYT